MLTQNFRSTPAILDFVNALFADAFAEPYEPLVPGRKPLSADQAAVEFLWQEVSGEADEAKGRPNARDRRRMEARTISRRLRERIDAGWIIRDRATGQPRRAHAGDIALLFRSMTEVGPYELALAEEKLEYHTRGGSAFYAQQEVHDLINLLSVIEDPLDTVALAGVLRSPFFCVSDDGLYWLSTAHPEGLAYAMRNLDAVVELSEADRGLADRAKALLERWRGFKDRVTIAALVGTCP